jgi:hypothetical protein
MRKTLHSDSRAHSGGPCRPMLWRCWGSQCFFGWSCWIFWEGQGWVRQQLSRGAGKWSSRVAAIAVLSQLHWLRKGSCWNTGSSDIQVGCLPPKAHRDPWSCSTGSPVKGIPQGPCIEEAAAGATAIGCMTLPPKETTSTTPAAMSNPPAICHESQPKVPGGRIQWASLWWKEASLATVEGGTATAHLTKHFPQKEGGLEAKWPKTDMKHLYPTPWLSGMPLLPKLTPQN